MCVKIQSLLISRSRKQIPFPQATGIIDLSVIRGPSKDSRSYRVATTTRINKRFQKVPSRSQGRSRGASASAGCWPGGEEEWRRDRLRCSSSWAPPGRGWPWGFTHRGTAALPRSHTRLTDGSNGLLTGSTGCMCVCQGCENACVCMIVCVRV